MSSTPITQKEIENHVGKIKNYSSYMKMELLIMSLKTLPNFSLP